MRLAISQPNGRWDVLGKHPDAGLSPSASLTTSKGLVRKPDKAAPFKTGKYWFDVFKSKYLLFNKIPSANCADVAQNRGWKRFTHWMRHHNPPFPESENFGKSSVPEVPAGVP